VEFPQKEGLLFGVAFDPAGPTWLGTQTGLWQAKGDDIVRPQGIDGESFGVINCLLIDREGNLWLGTERNGLYCLTAQPFRTYTTRDGLVCDDVWSLAESHDGTLWIATGYGASHFAGGRFTTLLPSTGNQIADLYTSRLGLITEDPSGTVWTGSGEVVFTVSDQRLVKPKGTNVHPLGILSSASGNINGKCWITGAARCLFAFANGTWECQTISDPNCPQPLDFLGVLSDRNGDLWIGSHGQGLFHFHQGRHTRLTVKDGLTSDLLAPMLADADGTVWAISDKGLNRVKAGKITRYTMREGLAENIILGLLEDDQGWFWLNGHQGVHRIQRQQLEDMAAGKIDRVSCMSYGLEDGLASVEGNGGTLPNSCKTRDGRVWFPTTGGLAVADPALLHSNTLPPVVVIESLQADGELVYDHSSGTFEGMPRYQVAPSAPEFHKPPLRGRARIPAELRLKPGHANSLLFAFTANTFPRTDQVRFRYRIEGHGSSWVDLGTQSSALIRDLSPGAYRFQVTGCNAHGVWNRDGTSLAFYVAPFFYQTWTFYGICAVTLAAGIAGFEAYRHSVRRTIVALEKKAALASERERIARDLHDDLGVSASRIAQLSELAQNKVKSGSEPGPQLVHISELANQVVDNIGELVWATNFKYDNLASVTAYFREYAARFFDGRPTECRLDFPSKVPEYAVKGEFRRELFLILKEALQNVAKHSQASNAEVRLAVCLGDPGSLELIIHDNGVGMDAERRPDFHHGLRNMTERVKNLGGDLKIESAPGKGTRISAHVPLPRL
jgi:signal transduction histidine kinase